MAEFCFVSRNGFSWHVAPVPKTLTVAGRTRHNYGWTFEEKELGYGIFKVSDSGGLFIPTGALWQDTARTTRAAATGDPVAVWDNISGGRNAVTLSKDSRPKVV